MTPEQIKLIAFAELVLDKMEATSNWDADMVDDISAYAFELKLAKLNAFHEFARRDTR